MLLPLYRVASAVAHRVPFLPGDLGRCLSGRRDALERWQRRAVNPADHPIWFHAASVGEAHIAEPIVARLRQTHGSVGMILTYSSASAARWTSFPLFDATDYMPPDTPDAADRFLDATRPSVCVVCQHDLWPSLLERTLRRIPVALAGATAPGSAGRGMYAPILERVSWIGAATAADAASFVSLGVPPSRVVDLGDPRHDRVLEREPDYTGWHALSRWGERYRVLVAGSLEPGDLAPIVEATRRICADDPAAGVLAVPHRPTRGTEPLRAAAVRAGLPTAIWQRGGPIADAARLVIVAEQGVLADAYALGVVAYVGGGFDRGGVHAVSEPAAYGLPILVGPRHRSRDVGRLLAHGALSTVSRSTAAEQIASAWHAYHGEPATLTRDGLAARRSITRGAAAMAARAISSLRGSV